MEIPGGSRRSAPVGGSRGLRGHEHRGRSTMDRGARRTPRRPTRLPFRSLASERVANRAVRHRRVSADRGIVLLDAAASASGWISRTPDRDLSSAPSQRARPGEAISGSDVGRGDSSRPASRRVVCVAAAWDLVERSRVCGPLRIPMGYGPTVWDRGGVSRRHLVRSSGIRSIRFSWNADLPTWARGSAASYRPLADA